MLSAPAHARSITCPRVRDKATYVLAPATSAPPCFCSAKARANSMARALFFPTKRIVAGEAVMRSMAPGGMARAKPRGRSHTAAAVLVTVSYLMRPAGAFRALFGCHRIAAAHTAATRMSSRPPPAEWADAMAKQALAGLQLEYPHKVDHLWLARDGALSSPASLHPVFYGNYDWHSAVHSHWCLVRLLRRFPEHIEADAVAAALRGSITAEGCNREAAYFSREGANTFERPYGWGWLMKLAEECALASKESEDSTNPCAPYHTIFAEMSRNLLPLTQVVREGWLGYLPRLSFPVRSGVHSNTAFALALSFDYAQTARDSELKDAIALCSRRLFGQDVDYNPAFEPSGAADLDDKPALCMLTCLCV